MCIFSKFKIIIVPGVWLVQCTNKDSGPLAQKRLSLKGWEWIRARVQKGPASGHRVTPCSFSWNAVLKLFLLYQDMFKHNMGFTIFLSNKARSILKTGFLWNYRHTGKTLWHGWILLSFYVVFSHPYLYLVACGGEHYICFFPMEHVMLLALFQCRLSPDSLDWVETTEG